MTVRYGIEINSFRGLTPGAIHYYARAWTCDEDTGEITYVEELEKELTQEEVDFFNSRRVDEYDYEYELGDTSGSFLHISDVYKVGMEYLKNTYGDDIEIEMGDPENLDNMKLT